MSYLKKIHRRLLPDDPSIGWTPYLWLVYLIYFFYRFYFVLPSVVEILALSATVLVFLVLYFNGYWRRGWSLLPNMVGLMALGMIWAPSNFGASVFFIYAAAFAAGLGPMSRVITALVVITAIVLIEAWTFSAPMMLWVPPAILCVLIGLANLFQAERDRQAAVLRLTQQEVRHMAQVAERERISRDLHDLLGHTLSVITLKAELASRVAESDPQRAAVEMREVETVSREALAQIREAVSGMSKRGLSGEMEQARLALKAAGIDAAMQIEVPDLKAEIEATLAMVLREAVTNVARHSRATRCTVSLQENEKSVVLEVRDDGRGVQQSVGSGIRGMRARLTDIGGQLDIDTKNGEWILRATIPA